MEDGMKIQVYFCVKNFKSIHLEKISKVHRKMPLLKSRYDWISTFFFHQKDLAFSSIFYELFEISQHVWILDMWGVW